MTEKIKNQTIEILTTSAAPEGEALLRQFIWLNTAIPKYKAGDPVKFRPTGVSICRDVPLPGGGWDHQRRRCGEVIGKVTEVKRVLREMEFIYRVEYETDLENGEIMGKHVTGHTSFQMEQSLIPADAYAVNKWSDL